MKLAAAILLVSMLACLPIVIVFLAAASFSGFGEAICGVVLKFVVAAMAGSSLRLLLAPSCIVFAATFAFVFVKVWKGI